jgi:hypothetical protein
MEVDGDGSGGTSPSRQGAGTETSIPRNSSAAAAELRNSFKKFADSPRFFRPEALNRRRGIVIGQPGAPHTRVAWPGPGSCHLCVRAASGPPPALFRSSGSFREKIRLLAFVSSNSENISCVAFLKHKTAENRELALWHLVNRLVPEIV